MTAMGKGEMGSPAPAQLLDSGLCGLSLVAGYYRIAGDPVLEASTCSDRPHGAGGGRRSRRE